MINIEELEQKHGVYFIKCLISPFDTYIGRSKNIKKRITNYKNNKKDNIGYTRNFQASLQFYNKNKDLSNYQIKVVYCDDKQLIQLQKEMIEMHRPTLNMKKGDEQTKYLHIIQNKKALSDILSKVFGDKLSFSKPKKFINSQFKQKYKSDSIWSTFKITQLLDILTQELELQDGVYRQIQKLSKAGSFYAAIQLTQQFKDWIKNGEVVRSDSYEGDNNTRLIQMMAEMQNINFSTACIQANDEFTFKPTQSLTQAIRKDNSLRINLVRQYAKSWIVQTFKDKTIHLVISFKSVLTSQSQLRMLGLI